MRGSCCSDAATGPGFPCIYMPQIQVSTFVSSLSAVSASSSLFTILQISGLWRCRFLIWFYWPDEGSSVCFIFCCFSLVMLSSTPCLVSQWKWLEFYLWQCKVLILRCLVPWNDTASELNSTSLWKIRKYFPKKSSGESRLSTKLIKDCRSY